MNTVCIKVFLHSPGQQWLIQLQLCLLLFCAPCGCSGQCALPNTRAMEMLAPKAVPF